MLTGTSLPWATKLHPTGDAELSPPAVRNPGCIDSPSPVNHWLGFFLPDQIPDILPSGSTGASAARELSRDLGEVGRGSTASAASPVQTDQRLQARTPESMLSLLPRVAFKTPGIGILQQSCDQDSDFQCRGYGFDPWWGSEGAICPWMQPKIKKKKKNLG